MCIELRKATLNDSETLWQMQVIAFEELLKKYQDYKTNPASEKIQRTIERLSMPETYYYFIAYENEISGAIRVVDLKDNTTPKRISPLWIMPEYRDKGYGKGLLKVLAGITVERGCGRLEWQCLDWNKPSIDFYISLGAVPMEDWTLYRLTGDTLINFTK